VAEEAAAVEEALEEKQAATAGIVEAAAAVEAV
jgi:hypothetical protein